MDIQTAVLSMVDALDAEQIPYMLVGSFSSNFYGIPRSTQDGDFVVELGDRSLSGVRRHLPEFHFDPQLSFESVTGTPFKIELFRLSTDPHDQERFRRRKTTDYFDRKIKLPTAEDVIITKLFWLKHAARSKDRNDIREVVAVQTDNLDWPYIRRWTDEHGTTAILEEIRRSIPPI